MINPALLKALIPQDVMDNVQNAAQAFIEMRDSIARLEVMVSAINTRVNILYDEYEKLGHYDKSEIASLIGLPRHNGTGTE